MALIPRGALTTLERLPDLTNHAGGIPITTTGHCASVATYERVLKAQAVKQSNDAAKVINVKGRLVEVLKRLLLLL